MSRHTGFLVFLRVLLAGSLTIAGCSSDNASVQESSKTDAIQLKAVKKEVGEASWYGPGFHGQETASGDTFNQNELTAAHPNLPMGSKATVTNLENGKKVEVTINDRGPTAKVDRVIDLSSGAANKLDMKADGTAQVKIETKKTKK